MTQSTSVLIVGAGPTGLGAAWRLLAQGETDWLLCEAAPDAGGLAGSVVDDSGFTWDLGGHVQFSHYDYFDDLMDDLLGPEGWLYHQRSRYPFSSRSKYFTKSLTVRFLLVSAGSTFFRNACHD